MDKEMKNRLLMGLLVLALAVSATVTGTLAYLNARADSDVQNTFTPAGDRLLTRADAFVLREHALAYAPEGVNGLDGTVGQYALNTAVEVSDTGEGIANSYPALPGAAMPKDPFVRIDPEGKTEVPAYVYIEVEGRLHSAEDEVQDDNLNFVGQIDPANWMLLEGIAGPHSMPNMPTKVYQLAVGNVPVRVYTKEAGGSPLYYQTVSPSGLGQEEAFAAWEFNILKDRKIRIAAKPFNAPAKGSGGQINRASYELTFYGYMAQAYQVDGAECFSTIFLSGSDAGAEPGGGGGNPPDMAGEMQ